MLLSWFHCLVAATPSAFFERLENSLGLVVVVGENFKRPLRVSFFKAAGLKQTVCRME